MIDGNRYFVILDNPATAQEVEQVLRRGGIEPHGVVQEALADNGGTIFIFIDLLARRIWDEETRQKNCRGHCLNQPGSPRHAAWEQLSGKQKNRFIADVANCLDAGRRAYCRPIISKWKPAGGHTTGPS